MKIVAECIKFLSAGVLLLAVIFIVIAGITLMTARDDAAQVAKAKKRILEIVIGIAAYALMFVVADLFIPGGIAKSTLDSSTTSCPDTVVEQPSPENPGGASPTEPVSPTGKYPMAHLADSTVPGYIQCPRNANYAYAANPNAKSDAYDKFFQAQAQSCPFSEIKYTKTAEDLACAPGYTMHYTTIVNEKRKNGGIVKETMGPFCIVNSKVDVEQYQHYLVENYISQDNRICTSTGECIDGGENAPNGIKEYFCCNYFSYTFAANLNHGEVVSNDILTSKCGAGFHAAYHRYTSQGNKQTTWGGRSVTIYDDNLTGININPEVYQPLPYPEISTVFNIGDTLNTLRKGKAVTLQTGGDGWGHYITAVGFTKDCAIDSNASCTFDDIVFLNSTYGSSIQVKYGALTNATRPSRTTEYICTTESCKTKR